MNITFFPSVARGEIVPPPSKSELLRVLLAAGLADGRTDITLPRAVPLCDDAAALVCALRAGGISITETGNGLCVDGAAWRPAGMTDVGESAFLLRTLLPIAAACGRPLTAIPHGRLSERPDGVLRDFLENHGVLYRNDGETVTVRGRLSGGTYTVRGDVSSQFLSGLLYALPLCDTDSCIKTVGRTVSRPYIDMTKRTLTGFGIEIHEHDGEFLIPGRQTYRTPGRVTVPCDPSAAVFPAVLNLIGGRVRIRGLSDKNTGDAVFLSYFFDPSRLRDGTAVFDLTDTPDLAPALFAAAALVGGATLKGTGRLADKESDRVAAMTAVIEACGGRVTAGENTVTIRGGHLYAPAAALSCVGDHRIAMAAAVILSHTGGVLTGAEAVKKSYPTFYADLAGLGINMRADG